MTIEIAFRIDNNSKLYLKNKVDELGIQLSKLVRIIIDNSPIFAYSVEQVSGIIASNNQAKFDARIYVQIDEYTNSKLTNLVTKCGLSLSQIMRAIIILDNTELVERGYINKCLAMLYPIGIHINQIAYQLNLDHVKKIIGYQSYNVASSRLKIAEFSLSNVSIFINNSPYDEIENVVFLVNKHDVLAWMSAISPMQNNINQIAKRLHNDFLSNKIYQQQFDKIFSQIKQCKLQLNAMLNSIKMVLKHAS